MCNIGGPVDPADPAAAQRLGFSHLTEHQFFTKRKKYNKEINRR